MATISSPIYEAIENASKTYEEGSEAFSFVLESGTATLSIGGQTPVALKIGFPVAINFGNSNSRRCDTLAIVATSGLVKSFVLY